MRTVRTEVGREAIWKTGHQDFAEGASSVRYPITLVRMMCKLTGVGFGAFTDFPATHDGYAREIAEALFAEWYGLTDRDDAVETPETIDMRPGPLAGVLNTTTKGDRSMIKTRVEVPLAHLIDVAGMHVECGVFEDPEFQAYRAELANAYAREHGVTAHEVATTWEGKYRLGLLLNDGDS